MAGRLRVAAGDLTTLAKLLDQAAEPADEDAQAKLRLAGPAPPQPSPAGGALGCSATNVPIGLVTTRASAFSASSAFLMVVSATP